MLDYIGFVLVVLSFSMLFCGIDASSRRKVIDRRRVHRGNPTGGGSPLNVSQVKKTDLGGSNNE